MSTYTELVVANEQVDVIMRPNSFFSDQSWNNTTTKVQIF